jgi:hypothetical protein
MVERVSQLAHEGVNFNLFSPEDLALQLAKQIDEMLAEALVEARATNMNDTNTQISALANRKA